jgi:L-fuculose-phosphate aldolase
MSNTIKTLEDDLRIASTILEWESGDIFGHVGVRLPDNAGIACKAFRPASDTETDWLVHFNYDVEQIGGNGMPPLEWPMYTEIFNRRPDVNAISHTHMPACIALSLVNRTVLPIHLQSAKFKNGVPMYPHPIHIKDRAEGQALADALGDEKIVVIKGHGVVAVGRDIDEACMNNLYLERTAKIMGMAGALGFAQPEQAFVDDMAESQKRMTAINEANPERAKRRGYSNEWRYYKNKILQGERWTRGWS